MSQRPPFAVAVLHEVPMSGYFVGRFAIPQTMSPMPATLRGPRDELAVLVHQAYGAGEPCVYQFDAFADGFGVEQHVGENGYPLRVVPWVARSGPPLRFAAHPRALDNAFPTVAYEAALGVPFPSPGMDRVDAHDQAVTARCVWDDGETIVEAFYALPARAPGLFVFLTAQRHDGQDGPPVRVSWPDRHVVLTPCFGQLASRSVVRVVPGEDAVSANLKHGFWYGLALEGLGTLLGMPVVYDLAGARGVDPADVCGRDRVNDAGVDACYGATWTSPIFGMSRPLPERLARLVDIARFSYARRPMHWRRVREAAEKLPNVTLHKGQPTHPDDALALGVGPKRETPVSDPVQPFDHEHRTLHPLAVLVALTADVGLIELAKSLAANELHERTVLNAWTAPGRGQARPWHSGTSLMRALGMRAPASLRLAWADHDATRLQRYRAARKSGPAITVGGLYDRASPWLVNGKEQLYSVPYEQAQLVEALYAAGHVRDAYEHGLGLATSLFWAEDGTVASAYMQRWLNGEWPHEVRVGQPINANLRAGGRPLGTWAAGGIRATLAAARDLGESHPWLAVLAAALPSIDETVRSLPDGAERIAAVHLSRVGTAP